MRRAEILLALSLAALLGVVATARAQDDRDGRWRADLDHFAAELPDRHKNLFFEMDEESFLSRVEALRERVPQVSDDEIVVGLMEIVAAVGDAHTTLDAGDLGLFRRLPIAVQWFSDGLHVTATLPGHEELLGKKVLAIGRMPVDEALDLVKRVVPHENEAQLKLQGPRKLVIPEILAALGIADGKHAASIEVDSVGEVTLEPIEMGAGRDWVRIAERLDCSPPLYLQKPSALYWSRLIEETKTLYVQYNACREAEDLPFDEFATFLKDYVDHHEVDRWVIDLRRNGGGNSSIARPLIKAVKRTRRLNRKGRLYVIVGRRTFSSAILNALQFRNQTKATLVGEPTGGRPNHYGEVRWFELPESGISVSYSTKYFTLAKDDTPSLMPDVEVPLSFEDFLACRDPALEAIHAD